MEVNVNLIMSTLNLNKYEAMMLDELLKENPLQTRHLHERSGIPRSRVYDVSLDLKRKGFLTIEEPRKIKVKLGEKLKSGKESKIMVDKTIPTTFRLLSRKEIIKKMENDVKLELKLRKEALLMIFKNAKPTQLTGSESRGQK